MHWGKRWRWRRGRPPKPRRIVEPPAGWGVVFVPFPVNAAPPMREEPVILYPDEMMALWLVYYEGLSQEEAAERMGVSRGTLWRILDSARKKLVSALVTGKPIVIAGPTSGAP